MERRGYLKSIFAVSTAALTMLGVSSIAHWTVAQSESTMDSTYRDKLILQLRRRGVRGGLDAKIGAILGLYNRGENLLVSRMIIRKDNRILTFARIVMRNRELYYWGFQPDSNVSTTYFFVTGWEFKLVARGAQLVDGEVAPLSPERAAALFEEVIKDWVHYVATR
jgi:hypothetical protein